MLIHPFCNRFDAEFVQNQWDQTQHFYNEHLREFIGPLLGRASDGDSRRRKLMLQAALSNIGARYQPVPRDLGFIFTCLVDEETRTPQDLMDQDYIFTCLVDEETRIPQDLMDQDYIFTCLVDEKTRTPQDLMDQDYIHNHKKTGQPLTSRIKGSVDG